MSRLRWTADDLTAHMARLQRLVNGDNVRTVVCADDSTPMNPLKAERKTDLFSLQLTGAGVEFVTEHRFHRIRKWRFDYAIPARRIAVEIDGGIWIQGRHNRGAGYLKDMVKLNAAVLLGWRVLRFIPQQVACGEAIRALLELLRPTTNTLSGRGHGGGEASPVASERVPKRSKEKAKLEDDERNLAPCQMGVCGGVAFAHSEGKV